MSSEFAIVPTVAIYLTDDGEKHIVPMPQLTMVKGHRLEKIQDLVAIQIAVVEADKTGRDRNDEVRRFRFGWYGTGSLTADLSRTPAASAMKHLLLAVQEELCDKEDLGTLEAAAIASYLQLGLRDIRSGEPGGRVFIIHGRDEDALGNLAAFIERQGYQPLILSRQPVRGETIIEALERLLPEADLIVALFTPDDEGRLHRDEEPLKPRVRQNVLVEAGFAMIQRRQDSIIVALGKTEVPTDLDGIRRIQADGWGYSVEQQLREALRQSG
jgi:hypothetical protein